MNIKNLLTIKINFRKITNSIWRNRQIPAYNRWSLISLSLSIHWFSDWFLANRYLEKCYSGENWQVQPIFNCKLYRYHIFSDMVHKKAITSELYLPQTHGSEVTQSCLNICDPMDSSLPGSSVHGIFQARVLEWVAISFSRGSSQPKDWTQVSHVVSRHFTLWATREVFLFASRLFRR